MSKRLVFFIIAISCFILVFHVKARVNFPQPTGHINDYVGLLSQEKKDEIEKKLQNYKKNSTNEIAVVIVDNLQDFAASEYANRLFETWGIGDKNKNNGVLILISTGGVSGQRDIFIEVGYGLEPVLTDGQTGSILRQRIIPQLKAGNYDEAVTQGIDAIMQVLDGEPLEEESEESGLFGGVVFLGLFLIQYLVAFLSRSKSSWMGGILGAGAALIAGLILSLAFAPIIAMIAGFGGLGLLVDYFVSKNYQVRKAKGLPTDWWSSHGGFGSGSSSGGFGGFGGGLSGGGGAGGKW